MLCSKWIIIEDILSTRLEDTDHQRWRVFSETQCTRLLDVYLKIALHYHNFDYHRVPM